MKSGKNVMNAKSENHVGQSSCIQNASASVSAFLEEDELYFWIAECVRDLPWESLSKH